MRSLFQVFHRSRWEEGGNLLWSLEVFFSFLLHGYLRLPALCWWPSRVLLQRLCAMQGRTRAKRNHSLSQGQGLLLRACCIPGPGEGSWGWSQLHVLALLRLGQAAAAGMSAGYTWAVASNGLRQFGLCESLVWSSLPRSGSHRPAQKEALGTISYPLLTTLCIHSQALCRWKLGEKHMCLHLEPAEHLGKRDLCLYLQIKHLLCLCLHFAVCELFR